MQTAWEIVLRAAERHPDRAALMDERSDRGTTYLELVAQVEALAAGLSARGIAPGDLVATVLPGNFDHCISLLALLRLGAVPALVNPRLQPREIAALLETGGVAGALVQTEGQLAAAARGALPTGAPFMPLGTGGFESVAELNDDPARCPPAGDPPPEAPAVVFYTSGTTGLPKGVLVPHRAVEPRVLCMATQGGLTYGPHNRSLILFPLHHVMGFFAGFLATLGLGGTYFVASAFEPGVALETIRTRRITYLGATPTHIHALLNHPERGPADLAGLTLCVHAGAPMPKTTLRALRAATGARLVDMYGTTETMNSLFAVDTPEGGLPLMPGYDTRLRVGRLGAGVAVTARDGEEGELLVDASADPVFTGYLNRPDATAAKLRDGWYRTGDIAVRNRDGSFELRGRLDDVILSGGESIHPEEVERVLVEHPGVAEAAVVGLPDERWGERVVACIVKASAPTTAAALDEHCCASMLARFKRPRKYVFFETLPKNAAGKVLRAALQDAAHQRLATSKEEIES